MPSMTLTPDGLSASPGWAANTGTINDALVTNDGDTTYAEAGTNTETCTLTFSAPSVAEGAIASITSVQILTYGRNPARSGGDGRVTYEYEVGGDSDFAQSFNYINNFSHQSVNGTVRTTSPVSGNPAWSYANLGDIEIKLTKFGTASPDVRVTMVNLKVEYVEAASGYANTVIGVATANIGEVIGVATANIEKVSGV